MADGDGEEIRITGVVTNDATAAKAEGEVEDADVNAREISQDGGTSTADGETTTDSQGRYDLALSSSSDLMLVVAKSGDFETKAVVDTRAATNGSVGAVTMTTETSEEADVFLETRQPDMTHISMAEVAAWVSPTMAGRMAAGMESSADVAAAIGQAEAAERAYLTEQEGVSAQALAQFDAAEEGAFRAYQGAVTGAVSGSVHGAAMSDLRSTVATSGNDLSADARAREASRAAIVALAGDLDAQVLFELRRSAEISTAIATSAAVQSGFEAMEASDLETVSQAGLTLETAIENASAEDDFDAAWQAYSDVVSAQLSVELSVTPGLIDVALDALGTLKATMNASVATATSVDEVVEAKATYFTSAQSSLQSALDASANAEVGASLLTLVEVH